MEPQQTAVIFIDFENVYYHFAKDGGSAPGADVRGPVLAWLRELKGHISGKLNESVIGIEAYADFERIPEDAQGDLYLLGAETHNVLGTDHKNAADMKLCIDALETLYTRPAIHSFVLVAGDRDYIPLIRHLRKQGKMVRVVSFPESVAGDLLTTVGSENFLDGRLFLSQPPASVQIPAPAPAPVAVVKNGNGTATRSAPAAAPPAAARKGNDLVGVPEPTADDRAALQIIFEHFAGKPEVWLTPYLHKLRAGLPRLNEFERRELINRLELMDAIKVEKRPAEPNPFSVLRVNWNHPLVRQVHGGKPS